MRTSWDVEKFASFLGDTLLSDKVAKYGAHVSVIGVKGNTVEVSLSNGDDFILKIEKEQTNEYGFI